MFFLYALIGTVAASILACIPALHVYNLAGLLLALGAGTGEKLDPEALSGLMLGLITGYATLNTIPSIFFAVPDDSTLFVLMPGQKYLRQRRGWEAALLTGAGGLGGIAVLALMTPFAPTLLATLRAILQPHLGWILAAVTLFTLQSEWPKGGDRGATPWRRLACAWTSLGAGLLTFFLSGLLGFLLLYRGVLPVDAAFQNLMPAFVGLFAIPWLALNLISSVDLPPQQIATSVDASPALLCRGIAAGTIGGLFAAFFPIVSGGVGGLIAGHATAQQDDRLFLISQGACKSVYYVGSLLLFFVPGLHLTRGGMAWMLSTVYTPYTPTNYHRAVAAILLSGVVAFFMLLVLTRFTIRVVGRVNYAYLSGATLMLLLALVALVNGPAGLLVAGIATGIGLIPALWGARRMNGLGLLLLPVTLNMLGVGDTVAGWLGLL